MRRFRLMIDGAWPSIIVISVALFFAWLAGGDFPSRLYAHPVPPNPNNYTTWVDFLIFVMALLFLGTKSTIILQRLDGARDWLAYALIAANTGFSIIYGIFIFRPMFGELLAEHRAFDMGLFLFARAALIWTLGWGLWQVTNAWEGDDRNT